MTPVPGARELVGTGLVLDDEGGLRLCLGHHTDSVPPQGDGVSLVGWDWDAVHPVERDGHVTWGDFVVTGTWDGQALTLTRPAVALALHDPPPRPASPDRPLLVGHGRGRRVLERVQQELHGPRRAELGVLTSCPEDGRLWVLVVHDDGALQRQVDEDYGVSTVVLMSALEPLGP